MPGARSPQDEPAGDQSTPGQRPADPNPQRETQDQLLGSYRMAGLGTEFVAAILVPTGIGWLLDRWLHTLPWFMVAGVVLGFAAGMVQLVRAGRRGFRD